MATTEVNGTKAWVADPEDLGTAREILKATAGITQLLEFTSTRDLRVEADRGIIRGVKVLGRTSRNGPNGREYSAHAISAAKGLYEGIRVNIDHPSAKNPGEPRRLQHRFGCLQNVTESDDGLRADLHFLKSHPLAAMAVEAAERMPEALGLSHNAEGRTSSKGGKVLVEEITRVRSVDLVSDPASTQSLFEAEGAIMPSEQELAASPAVAGAAPEAGASPGIKEAFGAEIAKVFADESLDVKATLKKIGDLVRAYEKLSGKVPEEEQEPEVPAEAPTVESLQAENANLKARDGARNLLESLGVQAEPARVAALARCGSDVERKQLAATWPKDTGVTQQPRSGVPLVEAKTDDGFQAPANADEFRDHVLL